MGASFNQSAGMPLSVNGKGGFQGPQIGGGPANPQTPGGQAGNVLGQGIDSILGATPLNGVFDQALGGQSIGNVVGNSVGAILGQTPLAPFTDTIGMGRPQGPTVGFGLPITGDLTTGNPQGQPGNRFMPGGMIPPAGARPQVRGSVPDPRRLGRYNPQPVFGNPRQFNPGQGPMQPGMPAQPPRQIDPGYGVSPIFGGGGKGGFQGPGRFLL